MARRFETKGNPRQASRFSEDAVVTRHRAALVRRTLLDHELVDDEPLLPIRSTARPTRG
jgi:hypothetical protein